MGAMQVLELVLLALEKGPEVVKAVRDSFANEAEPSLEEIIKRMSLVRPAWTKDGDDPDGDDGADD